MTVSTHVYEAFLVGTPDEPIPLKSGSVTLDAGQSPHVQGSIVVDLEDVGGGLLDDLDPRLNARIRVDVAATFPGDTQTRSFDLGLRERSVDQRNAEVNLTLASDEALLEDYRPLADIDYVTQAADLSVIMEAVILEAIGDTVVVGGATADVTPYWAVTNLVPNPSAQVDTSGWITSTGASALAATTAVGGVLGNAAVRWTAAAGVSTVICAGWNGVTAAKELRVEAGLTYTGSVYVRSSVARSATFTMAFRDENGVGLPFTVSTTATTSTSAWTRYVVTGVAPVTAAFAYLIISTAANTAGQFHYGDAVMFHEGFEAVTAFDGTSTGGGYTYAWAGTAHASQSTRTPIVERDRESVIWRAGQAGIDFLLPLAQAAGLRPVCDEYRAWTLRDDTYVAPDALSIRHGVNLIDGSDTIARDSGIWFDAQVTIYEWLDVNDIPQRRIDAYELTPTPTRVNLVEINSSYPGTGRSQYAVNRAQGRGRELSATAVSDWRGNAEQPITVVLEGTPTQTGITQALTYSFDDDTMTVTTRTTDTPLGAIDLLVGNINSLVGQINAL